MTGTCRSQAACCIATAFALVLVCGADTSAQSQGIRGVVIDSATRAPLAGVRISVSSQAGAAGNVSSDLNGRFQLRSLPPGQYRLDLERFGYARRTVNLSSTDAERDSYIIPLTPSGILLDPVQVSASRIAESRLTAPVAVTVIPQSEVKLKQAFTPMDYVRGVPGVDFVSRGLLQQAYSARGVLTLRSLPVMVDYRYAALPGLSFVRAHLIPVAGPDIERIEVVRGPGAALYGPDADRGVVHLLTSSPFESAGTTLSVAGGERSVLQVIGRHAAVLNSQLAVRVSGDYFRGRDWESFDGAESTARARAVRIGNPDTVLIANRDFQVERANASARVDWRPTGSTAVIATAGMAQVMNLIEVSGAGASQMRDWRYSFAQARLHNPRLFANVTYNTNDAGETYRLRQGTPSIDQSRVIAAQLQSSAGKGPLALSYGLDTRWTDLRTGGATNGVNEDDDLVSELGAFLQARTALTPHIDVLSALRVDHNDRLIGLALSPRAGVVFRFGAQALRVTYNRAYAAPDPTQLFIDALTAIGDYQSWTASIPKSGYHFRRDCSGWCMRSRYASSEEYVPAQATAVWAAVMDRLQRQGFDVSNIPAPTASQVGTRFAEFNGVSQTFRTVPVPNVADFEPAKRAFTQVGEIGYRAVLGQRIVIEVDAFVNRVRDPFGPRVVATPTVMYDSATLVRYLEQFRTPAAAAALAGALTVIPVGTISPVESPHPFEVLLLNRQGGAYTLWGGDASITALVTPELSVTASYSRLSRNTFSGLDVVNNVFLSVPKDKGALTVSYHDHQDRLNASVQARVVGGPYRAVLGAAYDGIVQTYSVVDARVGFALPWDRRITIAVDGQNVLDHRHSEFPGAPRIGRLVLIRAQFQL